MLPAAFLLWCVAIKANSLLFFRLWPLLLSAVTSFWKEHPTAQHANGGAKIVYYDIVNVKLGNYIYKIKMISYIHGNLACHTGFVRNKYCEKK